MYSSDHITKFEVRMQQRYEAREQKAKKREWHGVGTGLERRWRMGSAFGLWEDTTCTYKSDLDAQRAFVARSINVFCLLLVFYIR